MIDERVATTDAAGEVSGEPRKKKKKAKGEKREKKVYEAGGIVVRDGKVVLRLTDEQNWIFPKGKLKKHETPEQAAIRECVEETGLEVEIVDSAPLEFRMHHEGKKRRFAFYLMRATGQTWDWPHHEGRDAFLIDVDRVGELLRHKGYGALWENARERVRALSDARSQEDRIPPDS